jgi:two-component system chemotaxis response regulator CheY
MVMALDVMIVDDSAAIRKILQRVLEQAEVPIGKVHEAGDGVEALQKLRLEPVGLILSDINMPTMDGLELLGRLKADISLKSVPVIMITTEGGQAKVLEAVNLGAAGYVRKPFTAEQIREKLVGIV